MSLAFLAHSPGGSLIYKTGTGELCYKGTPLPDPETPPTPTTGNHWYWQTSYSVYLTNIIGDFTNVSYGNGEYTRKYFAWNTYMSKSFYNSYSNGTDGYREIGTWSDSGNPHPQPYFWDAFSAEYDATDSNGPFEIYAGGRTPGSYPTYLFDIWRYSLVVPNTVDDILVPISGYYANGPHPCSANGFIQYHRHRY